MLFSQNMCFFKKPKPAPATLSISSPVSRPFDYEKVFSSGRPIPPHNGSNSKLASVNYLAEPAKVYTAKHLEEPTIPYADPQPTWNHRRSSSLSRTETSSSSRTAKHSPQQTQRKARFWTRRKGSYKGTLFRNAGIDVDGSLKLEYEEIRDTDWGEPDEWLPRERRPRYWQ